MRESEQEKEKENEMFDKPASATGIDWGEHKGRLLLIEPSRFESGVSTSLGDKDAVRATVTIVDAPDGPQEYNDTLIFPRVLISQTRSMIGKKVLGRLGQGQAKQGQNAPWRLDDYTDGDAKQAQKYIESRDAPAQPSQAAPTGEPPF